MLYPKGALKKALDARPELYPTVLSTLQGIDAARLIGEGRVYGGGLHKMEPKELGRLPAEQLLKMAGGISFPRQGTLFAEA